MHKGGVQGLRWLIKMSNIAVIGCLHGFLDKMYFDLLNWQNKNHGEKIDLVICCGDFQSLRDEQDMDAMSAPEKSLVNFGNIILVKNKPQ